MVKSLWKPFFLLVLVVLVYDYQKIFTYLQIFAKQSSLSVNEVHLKVSKRISTVFLTQTQADENKYNSEDACPTFSINNTSKPFDYSSQKCKPITASHQDCETAFRKYGRPPKDRTCPKVENQLTQAELCAFTDASIRTSNVTNVKLQCNFALCQHSPIRIGVLQPRYGLLVRSDLWYIAKNQDDIDIIVRRIINENTEYKHDFFIVACGESKSFVKQTIILPPFVKIMKTASERDAKPNINILVLDSVSRPHFYRQLSETVSTLKSIDKTETTVLDFELFHSLAPRTFPNMRALFSGIVDVDSDDETHTYGLDSLFGRYNNLGYQTTLQEDSCWYDSWGALITDNKHNLKLLSNVNDYEERWQEIQRKLRRLPIDSYGLTHFSCEVFTQYGKTNQFNEPPKVCFNGHHLPSYFLNYTYTLLQTVEQTKSAYPAFIYTHMNTGHEMTGKRIAYADHLISDFIKKTSGLKNTLTIILSDHGPKTSKFSQEFLAGRSEISHAMFFMIVPKKIRHILGQQKVESLRINQNRLVTHTDVFHTLMSLHGDQPSGLLSPISKERNCEDIPIYSFMMCLCEGYTEMLADFHPEVHWLAEFAIGYLNNQITRAGVESSTDSVSYGNCERLIGNRFDKIRKKVTADGKVVYTFDAIVDKYRDEEIFEVVVTLTNKSSYPSAKITRWRRVTIFQHFSKCTDPYVDVQLCICRKESMTEANPGRDLSRLLALQSFQIETKVKFIDSKCLALLVRWRKEVFKSYELANLCYDRIYNVTFDLNPDIVVNFKTSYELPQNITTYPWFVYFVTSIQLSDSFKGSILIEKISFQVIYESKT